MAMTLGSSPKPLTPKQAGQLKHLLRKLGPFAKQLVDYSFTYWAKFTNEVEVVEGVATFPEIPHTGFLLAYYAVAVNLMIDDKLVSLDDVLQALKVLEGGD
jgi:hypothetical protein